MRFTSPDLLPREILLGTDELLQIVVSENDLCDRYADAAPGTVIIYYMGLLARDRDAAASSLAPDARTELDRVAERAWAMAEQGLVHLLQRRVAPECFAYLAATRARPRGSTPQRVA